MGAENKSWSQPLYLGLGQENSNLGRLWVKGWLGNICAHNRERRRYHFGDLLATHSQESLRSNTYLPIETIVRATKCATIWTSGLVVCLVATITACQVRINC